MNDPLTGLDAQEVPHPYSSFPLLRDVFALYFAQITRKGSDQKKNLDKRILLFNQKCLYVCAIHKASMLGSTDTCRVTQCIPICAILQVITCGEWIGIVCDRQKAYTADLKFKIENIARPDVIPETFLDRLAQVYNYWSPNQLLPVQTVEDMPPLQLKKPRGWVLRVPFPMVTRAAVDREAAAAGGLTFNQTWLRPTPPSATVNIDDVRALEEEEEQLEAQNRQLEGRLAEVKRDHLQLAERLQAYKNSGYAFDPDAIQQYRVAQDTNVLLKQNLLHIHQSLGQRDSPRLRQELPHIEQQGVLRAETARLRAELEQLQTQLELQTSERDRERNILKVSTQRGRGKDRVNNNTSQIVNQTELLVESLHQELEAQQELLRVATKDLRAEKDKRISHRKALQERLESTRNQLFFMRTKLNDTSHNEIDELMKLIHMKDNDLERMRRTLRYISTQPIYTKPSNHNTTTTTVTTTGGADFPLLSYSTATPSDSQQHQKERLEHLLLQSTLSTPLHEILSSTTILNSNSVATASTMEEEEEEEDKHVGEHDENEEQEVKWLKKQLAKRDKQLTKAKGLLRNTFSQQVEELEGIRQQFQEYDEQIVSYIGTIVTPKHSRSHQKGSPSTSSSPQRLLIEEGVPRDCAECSSAAPLTNNCSHNNSFTVGGRKASLLSTKVDTNITVESPGVPNNPFRQSPTDDVLAHHQKDTPKHPHPHDVEAAVEQLLYDRQSLVTALNSFKGRIASPFTSPTCGPTTQTNEVLNPFRLDPPSTPPPAPPQNAGVDLPPSPPYNQCYDTEGVPEAHKYIPTTSATNVNNPSRTNAVGFSDISNMYGNTDLLPSAQHPNKSHKFKMYTTTPLDNAMPDVNSSDTVEKSALVTRGLPQWR